MAAMATGRGRGRGRGRSPTGKPNPIDIHVGSRIRLRRTLLGMSQQKLGEAIGLTFQQVQKYERGANRVGSSRMFELARVLDVPISYFFEEMGSDTAQRGRQHALGHAVEIVEAEPGRCWAFVTGGVAMNIALWKYTIEPTGAGCRLTESYELRTLPPTMVDGGQEAIDQRMATNRESVRATLAGIKAAAEG